MFEFDSQIVVGRITYRLLRSLHDPNRVEDAVRAILPELSTLSSKLELITDVGYREGSGHKLVSEAAAQQFEESWRVEVRANRWTDRLEDEWDLLRVLSVAKRDAAPQEPALEVPGAPEVTLALLRAARTEVRSQAVDSRAVRRAPRLHWDVLVELFGGNDDLRGRVERLRDVEHKQDDELLSLVDRYLGGWRPDRTDDERFDS
jgi:hypothetical protein